MSHRRRTEYSPVARPAMTAPPMPQKHPSRRPQPDISTGTSRRLSLTSTGSSGRRSSTSVEHAPASRLPRPSGIPRSVAAAASQARLQALAAARPATAATTKPGPLYTAGQVAGSKLDQGLSARTMHSSQIKQALRRREAGLGTMPMPEPGPDWNRQQEFASESASHPSFQSTASNGLPPRLVPELQALAASTRRPTWTPSTFSTVSSTSPSTQFTGSPSPWSASTATTASTSWSSASPSLLYTARSPVSTKRSQTIPILTAGRTAMPRLHVPQEPSPSLPASVVDVPQIVTTPSKRSRKSPAPTPPPRSSSIKRSRSRSSSKSEDHTTESHEVAPPLPLSSEGQPDDHHDRHHDLNMIDHDVRGMTSHHRNLQNALYAIPSGSGIPDQAIDGPDVQIYHNRHDTQPSASRSLLDAAPIDPNPAPATLSSQPSRSRLGKFSRLGIFSRSTKNLKAEAEPKPPPRKLQRKGPAAGTGHEGYGKYARKTPRKSGEGSSGGTDSESSMRSSRGKQPRSGSQSDSLRDRRSSQSDLDDFAATRMRPVAILGGSSRTGDQLPTSGSSQNGAESTIMSRRPRPVVPPEIQSVDDLSAAVPPRVVPPAAIVAAKSSPALRQTQLARPVASPPVAESPVARQVPVMRPYVDSWNTSQSSLAPSYVTSTDGASDMFRVGPPSLDQRKKIRRSRWNIFRKRDAGNESTITVVDRANPAMAEEMPVSISHIPVPRSVPYYAMLESEADASSIDGIGELLNEAARYADADDEDGFGTPALENEFDHRERVESVLLPSVPHFRRNPSRARKVLRRDQPVSAVPDSLLPAPPLPPPQLNDDSRQSRLAQVGRIPKVVPTTQVRQVNRKSFSRPFTQSGQPSRIAGDRAMGSSTYVPTAPPVVVRNDDELLPRSIYASAGQYHGWDTVPFEPIHVAAKEMQMSSEYARPNDRQSFVSSSSEGLISVMGPPLLPSHVLDSAAKKHATAEDDIWKEYDDLIDHVTTPSETGKPSPSFDDSRIGSGDWQAGLTYPRSDAPSLTALAKGLAVDTSFSHIPILLDSSEVMGDINPTEQEIRLRRSRIVSALQSSIDPLSPTLSQECLSDQDYRADETDEKTEALTYSGSTPDSDRASPRQLGPSAALPAVPETQHYENAAHMDEYARFKNPVKHSEMSYASLMISRWLSFGQVLFSPAHAELQRQPEKHVLVIDGLGNDDWSIYCAVTYQGEHAYVYDLKEIGHARRPEVAKQSPHVPPNFRRRETPSFHKPFNFPDNFFSVIVFRFPPVMAESKLRNMVAECRRILAPGGHLELMLLDLDIVNMGVATRRAMRELKTKITMSNPDVSLRPVIDNIQGVLGDTGFSKLSRCVVGVPVIGKPPSLAESPVSSRSSGGSDQSPFSAAAGPRPFDGVRDVARPGFSLHDLVSDHSDGADAKISKMVSRTARSWWQHCFETGTISDGNLSRSVLANKHVLSECKSRASSFKLLIAYAQKPAHAAFEHKRRTMSEPFNTPLAVA